MIGISLLQAELTRDDDIVSDSVSKLEWQDNAVGNVTTWIDAIQTCEDLTLGGHNDWRLPNINELKSIVDRSKTDLAIKDGFINTSSSHQNNYWSSTTCQDNKIEAWCVNFGSGSVHDGNKGNENYVRCVRGGQ